MKGDWDRNFGTNLGPCPVCKHDVWAMNDYTVEFKTGSAEPIYWHRWCITNEAPQDNEIKRRKEEMSADSYTYPERWDFNREDQWETKRRFNV